jgi:hypothetical protein
MLDPLYQVAISVLSTLLADSIRRWMRRREGERGGHWS